MNKFLMLSAIMASALLTNSAFAQAVSTPTSTSAVPMSALPANPLDITDADRVQGSPMAPLTIIEYASLTCSHCADFARDTMPQVKKEWITTGKAKYVLRDLPWDNLALGMTQIARCAPAAQFAPLTETFFANQEKIMTGTDPLVEIKKITRVAGMSDAQVEACLKDPALHAQALASKDTAMNRLGVKGTPALFVNGTRVEGALPYKDFKKTLDAEYAKAVKK